MVEIDKEYLLRAKRTPFYLLYYSKMFVPARSKRRLACFVSGCCVVASADVYPGSFSSVAHFPNRTILGPWGNCAHADRLGINCLK